MASFKLQISTNSDAFQGPDAGESELARLLRCAADKVERGQMDANVFDINGNLVGRLTFED